MYRIKGDKNWRRKPSDFWRQREWRAKEAIGDGSQPPLSSPGAEIESQLIRLCKSWQTYQSKQWFVTDFFFFFLRLIKTMAYHEVFSSLSSFSPFFSSSSSSPFYRSITKGYNNFFFLFSSSLVQNTGLLLIFSHHWNQWGKHSFFLLKDTSLNKVRYWWLSVLANY